MGAVDRRLQIYVYFLLGTKSTFLRSRFVSNLLMCAIIILLHVEFRHVSLCSDMVKTTGHTLDYPLLWYVAKEEYVLFIEIQYIKYSTIRALVTKVELMTRKLHLWSLITGILFSFYLENDMHTWLHVESVAEEYLLDMYYLTTNVEFFKSMHSI